MTKPINETLDLNQLEQASGGSIFLSYKKELYAEAGVTIVGPGVFYDDGYTYNGQEISLDDANALTCYYADKGEHAPSLEEARRHYAATITGNAWGY